MKRIIFLLVAVATLAGVIAFKARASRHSATQEAAPIFVTEIPPGYRDWKLVSVAHEEGQLNDIRAILGNDVAIKTYRAGKLPFLEGTIIARIAWNYVPSEENNKSLAVSSHSSRENSRPGTCSLWSRTQRSTRRRAAGGTRNSTRTANLVLSRI